jgi:hypothetical protein
MRHTFLHIAKKEIERKQRRARRLGVPFGIQKLI